MRRRYVPARRQRFSAVATMLPAAVLLTLACTQQPAKSSPQPQAALLPADKGLRSVHDFAGIANEEQRALALMSELGKVIQHPRCVNCHPSGERPLQEDGIPHQPFVVGLDDGKGAAGQPCSACHGESNYLNVPGNPKWHLAPIEMAWQGRSLGQICEQLKDRARNGGKSMREISEHMAHDELVAYGWNPPPHLEAVPGNQALFGQLFQSWINAGAHCPK